MAVQKGRVSFPCHVTSGRKLNFSIKEHRAMVEKLNVILKDVKEHDSTIFQSNGLALKQGEEFSPSFNVKQIKCIEAKLTKVTQDMEALENKKSNYNGLFNAYSTWVVPNRTFGVG